MQILAPLQKTLSLPEVITTVLPRVFETQPLYRIIELDIHAEIVGAQLKLIAGNQARGFIDIRGIR